MTALFRCPSSIADLTEQSSSVCKPYLTARGCVSPYLEPYYNTYAAPYVDSARPYVESFDKRLLGPSIKYGNQTYQVYGAPRVAEIRSYSTRRWRETVKPQWEASQKQAKNQYDATLAPQVAKVSAVVEPYYTSSREQLTTMYNNHLLPAYTVARPYAEKAYSVAHIAVMETGLPYLQATWKSSVRFVDRTLWPKMRILYGLNVEPQLIRIGERLGRYRDGKRLRAAMEEIQSCV